MFLKLATLVVVTCLLLNSVDGAIDHQEVTNNAGVKQFTIDKGSSLLVPNLKRDKLGHVNLQLSLKGATVDKVSEKEPNKIWNLVLSDETTGEMSSNVTQGITEYYFVWPGSDDSADDREVCIHMGKDSSWYNTFQQKTQRWPMDTSVKIDKYPLNSMPLDWESEIEFIVEHMFLNSNGFAIMLDRITPLWLRLDPNAGDPLLCVASRKDIPYDTKNTDKGYTDIMFSIFAGENIRAIYDIVSNRLQDVGSIPKPKEIPDEFMFTYPSWMLIPGKGKFFATEADFTQDKVIQFSQELKKHSYRHNIISLEPDWQQDSPFLSFNAVKFPDPKHMMAEIHKGGYKLDLFVHPYVKNSSSDFDQKELFIKNSLGSQLMVKSDMFYKDRAIVDFSNVKARDWFEAKLTKLKTDFDIDSFIFNAIAFYDNHFTLSNPTIQKASVLFGEQYVRMASRFGLLSTVREGHKTQDLSIFTRMIDRQADWTYQKGLKSLIPTALAMSISGYSFIIPDIVGGRWGTPTEELYIRWAQASTFLPTMQFAIPPWDFGDKTAALVKNFVNLHTDHAATFMDLARKRVKDGTPILRPMWFVAPDDDHTYKIDDQFMVGDDLLVAPVLEEGKKERNVYLPKGVWIDQHGKYYYGPIQVTVSAPIEELPFFKRHIV